MHFTQILNRIINKWYLLNLLSHFLPVLWYQPEASLKFSQSPASLPLKDEDKMVYLIITLQKTNTLQNDNKRHKLHSVDYCQKLCWELFAFICLKCKRYWLDLQNYVLQLTEDADIVWKSYYIQMATFLPNFFGTALEDAISGNSVSK